MSQAENFYELLWMWIKLPHVFAKHLFSALVDKVDQYEDKVVVERRIIIKSRTLRVVRERIEINKRCLESTFSQFTSNAGTDAESQQREAAVVYKISLVSGKPMVEVLLSSAVVSNDTAVLGRGFLEATLREKLLEHWRKKQMDEATTSGDFTSIPMDGSQVITRSLLLVDHAVYYSNYLSLKQKYAQFLSANWSERTSPEKFIHEELAIAAYLITLWNNLYSNETVDTTDKDSSETSPNSCSCAAIRQARRSGCNRRPSFVDLGCGNGMLVFVLNSEGFAGVGVDVRERRSWQFYREKIGADKLVTIQLNPAELVLGSKSVPHASETTGCSCEWPFAACDWLIGNHADELSCWLPLLAARFSHAGYFLLPCCAFELSGARFSYRRANESLYQTYLRYVKHVSERCGYQPTLRQDRLRIPSTKRICYVASNTPQRESINFAGLIADRDYHRQLANSVPMDYDDSDDSEAEDRHHEHGEAAPVKTPSNADVVIKMQLRSVVEPVRNCAGLPAEFKCSLLVKIVNALLSAPDAKIVDCEDTQTKRRWNAGGSIRLDRLAALLSREDLQLLKAQCGGLQTFVRNHRHVVACDKTVITLSRPISKRDCGDDSRRLALLGTKPCWFSQYHPDGCLLAVEACACVHSVTETAAKANPVV